MPRPRKEPKGLLDAMEDLEERRKKRKKEAKQDDDELDLGRVF